MGNSSSSQPSPDSVASKLLDVDSHLATQEAQLVAQLESIQEKRKSLKSVLHLFGSDDENATPVSAAQPVVSTANGFVAESTVTVEAESDSDSPAEIDNDVAPKSSGKSVRPSKPSKSAKSSKTASRSKATSSTQPKSSSAKSNQSTDWQSYVRKEYRDRSLPQAVLLVLEQHPNEVVEVPSIIDAIFVDDIPKEARTNARDRLSNVLSVGLKNRKWYRGKMGLYSVSKEIAAANATS